MVDGTLALALIVLALLAFVAIGLRAARRGEAGAAGDVEEYVIARDSQGAGMLGLSFLASGMGAWILFAPPEVGAGVGAVAVIGYALGAAAPFVAFGLLGARLRAVVPAGHSLVEFVRLRFGRVFHAYVVAVSLLYMLIFVTAELTAVGGVAAILSGLDPRVAILGVAAATLAYTVYGGLRASLRTDRFQAWLILGLLAAGSVAIVRGLEQPFDPTAATGLLRVDRAGVQVALTLVIAVTTANLFHQGYWQRVWAARDTRALRRGVLLGVAATIPVVAVVGATGVLAVGAGVDLGSPPVPFFALLAGLPTVVGAVVLVLGVALVASSVDTLESGLTALATAGRPTLSLRGARLATLLLVAPAVAVAFQGYSVLRLFLVADLLCAATAVPALSGLWRRATARAALAGAVAGLAGAVVPGWVATGSAVEGFWLASFPGAVPTLAPFLGALAASALVTVAVSLAMGRVADLEAVGARAHALTGPSR